MSNSSVKSFVDNLHAEHHVKIFGCPKIDTGVGKQQIASRATDQGVLIFVTGEMLTKFVDTDYHDT
jgi:hypothetical protein